MAGEIEERAELGDGHLLRAGGELDDLVPRLDVALLEHAEVEARTPMRHEQRGDARVVQPDADAVTRHTRLRDLEDGGADPEAVADADLVVAQPIDGEVLAELSMDEVVPSELALPVAVGLDLVDEDGALLATVPAQVALPVPVYVEPAHAPRTGDGVLEDAGEDGLAPPRHVLRHADVHRQQGAGRTSRLLTFDRDRHSDACRRRST